MGKPQENSKICYRMAYSVVPEFAFAKFEMLHQKLSEGIVGVIFFYLATCKFESVQPDAEAAREFEIFSGDLSENRHYHIIKYPMPTPLPDILNSPDPLEAMKDVILAPYFSAVVLNLPERNIECFVLGQSPNGKTTFRSVTPNFNANLGPGGDPELESFMELLRTSATRTPVAGVRKPGHSLLKRNADKRWWQIWK